jgi:HEAT repeat protein
MGEAKVESLIETYETKNLCTRRTVDGALGEIGNKRIAEPFIHRLRHEDGVARESVGKVFFVLTIHSWKNKNLKRE